MDELHDLFDRHWAHLMAEYPEAATSTGWPEGHDRWTDLSTDVVERRKGEARAFLAEADALSTRLDPKTLDDVDRTSLEMFRAVEAAEVASTEFPGELLALHQMGGPQIEPAFMLGIMGKTTPKECDDVLARLRRLPELVDQTLELLVRGAAAGAVSYTHLTLPTILRV